MNKKFNTRRITFLGFGVAVAMLLSYVEFLLPPIWSAVPGIKIGLANIIIVYLFFKSGVLDAALVSLVRLFLSALLGGSLGAYMGMQSFRHKTRHLKFTIGLPAILLVHLAVGALLGDAAVEEHVHLAALAHAVLAQVVRAEDAAVEHVEVHRHVRLAT